LIIEKPKRIVKVWIDLGCIPNCGCADTCPAVFKYPDDKDYESNDITSKINGESRIDGITSDNAKEQCELIPEIGIKYYKEIIEAAYGCPVEVIKYTAE